MNVIDILKAAHWAPSADNSQPWCFRLSNSEIFVEYAADRVGNLTFAPDDPATLLAIGGLLENLIQISHHLSLECSWVLFPHGEKESTYFSFSLPKSDAFFIESKTKDDFANTRHTNRFPYKKLSIQLDLISGIIGMHEGSASLKFFDKPDKISAMAAVARQASEVRFQTQEVHEWLARSLRYSKREVARGDGLDLATIPLPPGGAVFMRFIMNWKWMSRLNLLGAYKLMAALDVKLLEQAPGLIAIVGGATREEIIFAGRLLTRVWTELNSKGLAVHPYYVVSDQLQRQLKGKVPTHLCNQIDSVAEHTANILNLSENQKLHMLLRVGYPIRVPARSRRLPLDALCHGL